MESGQSTFFAINANSSAPWNNLVAALGCSDASDILACVRAVPATTIKSIIEERDFVFRPVKDNVTYVAHPRAARQQGNIAQVPILIGSNGNEGSLFVLGFNTTMQYLQTYLPGGTQAYYNAILAAYPIGSSGITNEYERTTAIDTDFRFQCTAATVANDSIAAGFPTFRYFFNASFPNTQIFPDSRVYHSSEIVEIFGTYPRGGVTTKEEALSRYMQKAWADFAKNPKHGPGWKEVPEVGVLGNPGHPLEYTVPQNELDQRCALYKAVYDTVYS